MDFPIARFVHCFSVVMLMIMKLMFRYEFLVMSSSFGMAIIQDSVYTTI